MIFVIQSYWRDITGSSNFNKKWKYNPQTSLHMLFGLNATATISRTRGAWKGFCRLDDKHSTMPKSKLLPSKFCLIQSFTRPKYLPGWEKSSWDRCCASVCRAAGPPRWSTSRRDTRLWRHTRALHWMVFILERKAKNAVCFSNITQQNSILAFNLSCRLWLGLSARRRRRAINRIFQWTGYLPHQTALALRAWGTTHLGVIRNLP